MAKNKTATWAGTAWPGRCRGPAIPGSACRAALLLAMATAAFGAPRALLIGVSYQGAPYVSSLPGIDLDVNRMEQVARDLGIRDVRRLWNREATLDGIREALRDLGEGVGPDDLTLVYFSGHGTRVPDRGDRDEGDGRDEALVPFDARPAGRDLENALVDDEVGQLLDGVPSNRLLLVVDACHSGTAAKSVSVQAFSKAYVYDTAASKDLTLPSGGSLGFGPFGAGGAGRFIGIMASQDDETANATRRGSVLTNAVHQAVSAAMQGGGTAVTVEELFDRVDRRVAATMERLKVSQPDLSQHPSLFVVPGSEGLRRLRLPLRPGAGDGSRLDPPEDDPLINEWTRIAERARQRIGLTVLRETFTLHPAYTGTSRDCDPRYSDHLLSVEVVAPEDGYLNVVNAGQGERDPIVLFPNGKSTQDNRVRRGQRIVIPVPGADWCLPAASVPAGLDSQWVLIVAAFSERELNFYRDGRGSGQFKTVSAGSTRSFGVAGDGRPATDEPRISAVATAHLLIKRR